MVKTPSPTNCYLLRPASTLVAFFILPLVLLTSRGLCQAPSDEQFKIDAYQDALDHFASDLALTLDGSTYTLYKGFTADLDGDGVLEWIVSGSLNEQMVSVIVYYRSMDGWQHRVMNRCLGGSVVDIRIVDVDNDGRPDVYSVLQDADLKRYCRIASMSRGGECTEIFRLDTPGGLYCSSNISLTRASENESYRVRVDEIDYPTTDDGDVHQKIYFYKIVNRVFVLDHMIGGRQ